MAVYFFTLHAYRSWRPDHRQGYVRRAEGVLPPDPERSEEYDERATQPPVIFDAQMQSVMIVGAFDICTRREWRLHAVGFEPNHVHLLISWHGFTPWLALRATIKNLLSLFLGRLVNEQGRSWFVDGGSRKRVVHQRHFNYLIETYIPKHSQQK